MYYDVQKTAMRIKNLRVRKQLTQSEVAEKMGFSIGGYRKLECGKNGGSIDSLVNVAEFYNVSLDYLVYGMKEANMGRVMEDLTESQKNIVCATMADLAENIRKLM